MRVVKREDFGKKLKSYKFDKREYVNMFININGLSEKEQMGIAFFISKGFRAGSIDGLEWFVDYDEIEISPQEIEEMINQGYTSSREYPEWTLFFAKKTASEINLRILKEILYQVGDKELEMQGLACLASLEDDSHYKDETIWRLTKEDFDSCLADMNMELSEELKAELYENAKNKFNIDDWSDWVFHFIRASLNLENCDECKSEIETSEDEYKATCAVCGNTFDEVDVNMIDYDDDVCINCEKTYVALKKAAGYVVGISNPE